jgi:hypothetical protein
MVLKSNDLTQEKVSTRTMLHQHNSHYWLPQEGADVILGILNALQFYLLWSKFRTEHHTRDNEVSIWFRVSVRSA